MPDNDLSHFSHRVIGVIEDSCQGVGKDRQSLLERHTVLLLIVLFLSRIPIESHTASL